MKDEFYAFFIQHSAFLITNIQLRKLMKLRHTLLLAIIAILLAACNFTLAEDVTPPPNYVAPTPMPTMGPLYPASAPDTANGAVIYAEKCAPCHGSTGLGDGAQGKQLPVSVIPIGLPEIARKGLPSAWYTQVTQGNLDRFMPPFASLNDQERWDVVSYALTLHTTPEQIDLGKSLFETNCADCAKNFNNLEMMSALSENDLIRIIKEGKDAIPAFGKDFSDDEALAVAVYLRTLTFAPPAQPTVVPVTETPLSAEAGTPSAEITPVDGTQIAVTPEAGTQVSVTPEAAAVAGVGSVRGSIENQTGADLPSDVKVKITAFEHGVDPNAGPQETASFESNVNADGTYLFENIEIPENRIYIAEVEVNGLAYQSEFAVVEAGMTELVISPIIIFATTDDFTVLRVDSLQMFFDFASEGSVQIFAVYSITNTSDKTVVINMGAEQKVPFVAFPEGSEGLGYEAAQDSAAFLPTADGFAMPPSETPYGLIAFASIPKAKEIAISQSALLSIGELSLFLPEGVEAEGKTLTDDGVQAIQTTNFHVYTGSATNEGDKIEFTLTGEPKDSTAVNPDVTQNKSLLIGIGGLGIALILAGVWMFMRDRRKTVDEEEEEDDEFEDPESLMDAIIALDDLHRAGKLSDEAYQQRRTELKNALKRKG